MRKVVFLFLAGLLVWGIGCQKDALDDFSGANNVTFRTGEEYSPEVWAAIEAGVGWLAAQQDPATGQFGWGGSEFVARTALAIAKLSDYSIEIGFTPQTGPYASQISAGLDYIFSKAHAYGGGLYFHAESVYHQVYNTGLAMMAIAAYRCPDCVVTAPGDANGMTHMQALQEAVEYFTFIQNPDGGWRYYDNSEPSDNSNTGFAVLGLLTAKEYGCDVSAVNYGQLSAWLDEIQVASGGSDYVVGGNWVNVMKTGNLLFEFGFVGDAPESARVQAAIGYIEANWDAAGAGMYDPGWKPDNYLAMYCLMKGFVSMGIETITVGGNPIDWYGEISSALLAQQQPDGSWPSNQIWWMDNYLSTAFNLLTLEKITPVAIVDVNVDIKPGSCPNPFNRTGNGVVPIAVLGSEEFDVSLIDPATVQIEGVMPVNWQMEDVATPYTGELEGKDDCHMLGADGYTDLVFHFDNQALAALLSGYSKGDVVVLTVQGLLTDGRQFQGDDIIWIVK